MRTRSIAPTAAAVLVFAGLAGSAGLVGLLGLAGFAPPARAGQPVGTAFTYQGQLKQNGSLYGGSADFIFRLYDAVAGGTQIGGDQNLPGVQVDAGVFQVTLDFGAGAFSGDARWLEISAKASSDQNYTVLSPRQPCTPSPYAVYSAGGPGGGGGPWVVNGADVTYPGGSVGVTGSSSPFAGGKGVFFEGGNASFASIWGFDYDSYAPLNLSLNAPGGNVGIGTSAPNAKLRISSDTANTNALWVSNNNASFAALYVQNFAAGSFGIYDDASTKHYLSGYLGVGTLNPQAPIDAVGSEAIRGEGSGALPGFVAAGVHGIGGGNLISGYAVGVLAEGTHSNGLVATTQDAGYYGGYFKNTAGGTALFADGTAKVRTLQILGGADLAERFDVDQSADPGMVLRIDESAPGRLRISDCAYCRCVAGVVSGAEHLNAGVVLGNEEDGARGDGGARPLAKARTAAVALSGRVWVKCNDSGGPIRPGDLLTTSSRPGYAMRAADRDRLPGAVLGKAMSSLNAGAGMVLVLVSLQ